MFFVMFFHGALIDVFMRKGVSVALFLVLIQFLAAFYLYPSMPDSVAIHWNIHGEADGFGSKLVGLFLMPTIQVVLIPLFLVLPRIDPKGSVERLGDLYSWFITVFTFYMAYVFGLSVAWNLGYRFDFMRLLAPMLGVMFYAIGRILGKAEMNWFMGIRTPWTLSNQQVWEDTHRLGSNLFKISGLAALLGMFFSGWLALTFAVLPVMFSGVYLVVYSFLKFRQINRK